MFAAFLGISLAGCARAHSWHNTDITGSLPDLRLDMVRAEDGRRVTAADYRGKLVLLYFGYTYCPDACPTTLLNLNRAIRLVGTTGHAAKILFVTVDPDRDTLPILKQYANAFSQHVEALRGDSNAIAALAKRYRIAYSVKPADREGEYDVTHSSAVYVFDQTGAVRLLISSLSTNSADIEGTASDLGNLLGKQSSKSGTPGPTRG